MPLEAFPSAIPSPSLQIQSRTDHGIIRNVMESGRPRQRVVDSNELELVNVEWSMSEAEWAIFRAWHNTTITRGADWFTIDLDLDGDETKNYEVRLVRGSYTGTRSKEGSGHVMVRSQLEIIDRNLDAYP